MMEYRKRKMAELLAKMRVENDLKNDPRKRTLSRRAKRAEIRRIAQTPDIVQSAEEISAIGINVDNL